jgi:hypothetical protein
LAASGRRAGPASCPRARTRCASRRAVSDHAGWPARWKREVGWKRRR